MKIKCFEVLQKLFEKQIDLLVGKRQSFDYEVAVKAIRQESKFFGAPREHAKVTKEQKWPYFEAYRNRNLSLEEQENNLRDLRISTIEWMADDSIRCLRFSFNNGQSTTHIGERLNLVNKKIFSERDEIKKVVVGVREAVSQVDYLCFYGRDGSVLCKIEGAKRSGREYTVQLKPDEIIIGIHCTQDDKYLRGIGFYVYRPGIGLPTLN
jgi:hypothetical protein